MSRRWVTLAGTETWSGRLWRRVRRMFRNLGDLSDGSGVLDLLGETFAIVVVVILVVVLAVFVAVPLLLIIVDLLVVALLVVVGFVARILFRRPWTVEATADDGTRIRWRIKGWGASGDWRDDVARRLSLGEVPPGGEQLDPTPADTDN
ncbi:MAG: hypothetical protein S0880_06095 [Actinomycetota bacterium]|nr:hypothetical protein [Actinomycetota bacterium]